MIRSSEERGRRASIEGFANEKIVCWHIDEKIWERLNGRSTPFPLRYYCGQKNERRDRGHNHDPEKTVTKSVNFLGGSRGGVDRTYKSGVKT
ncbi:hypothetical protein KEJ47_10010 [Candidatus Bathyarchaeota archaeon]|nr:hypothetical protein [Candidatus Bathyarchaeota archaeon]